MKELRFSAADGESRVAFDPGRSGRPAGGRRQVGRRFYRALIRKACGRFDRHLAGLADEGGMR